MCCGDWEKAFFASLCTNAGSYSDMACILRLYICVCCKYANLVEIATCVRAQRSEKRFLSITAMHFCTPTWQSQHVRIRNVYGNIRSSTIADGRHCHDYKHRLTGRRMYSIIVSVLWAVHAVMRNPVLLLLLLLHCCSTAISTCKHYVFNIAKPLSFYIE